MGIQDFLQVFFVKNVDDSSNQVRLRVKGVSRVNSISRYDSYRAIIVNTNDDNCVAGLAAGSDEESSVEVSQVVL